MFCVIMSFQITGDLPHEVDGPGAFKDYLQARANNDKEVCKQPTI